MAVSSGDDFTATFLKTFFGMLIPTLVIGGLAKRRLRPAMAQTNQRVQDQRLRF
jgi:hypothetical protein